MVRVLMVCLGNICRSPMAEGMFRALLEQAGIADKVFVDSAGTHSYHEGAPPDQRSQQIAQRRGVDLRALRARRLISADLDSFDYILVMDQSNYQHLIELCTSAQQIEKIRLFMSYAAGFEEREVPDPYYGPVSGFERVMDMVEEASRGLLVHIRERYRI